MNKYKKLTNNELRLEYEVLNENYDKAKVKLLNIINEYIAMYVDLATVMKDRNLLSETDLEEFNEFLKNGNKLSN